MHNRKQAKGKKRTFTGNRSPREEPKITKKQGLRVITNIQHNAASNHWSMRILRGLNPIFFWISLVFLGWLVLEIVLGFLTTFWSSLILRAVKVPILAFIAPLAIGYWTAWLSLRLLFYPIEENALWQGVLAVRCEDLVGTVALALKEDLLSRESLQRYIEKRKILPDLLPKLAEASEGTAHQQEFKGTVQSILQEWIKDTLERDDAHQIMRGTLGRVIDAWHARRLRDKPLEWTKKVWNSWVLERVIEALPAIPEAMMDIAEEISPWMQQLTETLQHKGKPLEEALAQGLATGFEALDMEALVRVRLRDKDRKKTVKAFHVAVKQELRSLQAVGGLVGLLIAFGSRFIIFRVVLLALMGLAWLIYRFTKKKNA